MNIQMAREKSYGVRSSTMDCWLVVWFLLLVVLHEWLYRLFWVSGFVYQRSSLTQSTSAEWCSSR